MEKRKSAILCSASAIAASHIFSTGSLFLCLLLRLDGSKLTVMGLPPDLFRAQITEAKKRLGQLVREQQKINEESADLRELIRANANFLPDIEREAELVILEFLKTPANITEAVRLAIFLTSVFEQKATPLDLKILAESLGFDFSQYSNPMASVHTILKRMRDASVIFSDENSGTYWASGNGLAALTGDVVSPEIWHGVQQEIANSLIADTEGNWIQKVQQIGEQSIAKKAEAIKRKRIE